MDGERITGFYWSIYPRHTCPAGTNRCGSVQKVHASPQFRVGLNNPWHAWIKFLLFTTGFYLNLMLSLLQYIRFHFNINIFVASFIRFQIAVYAYVVLRSFTSPSSPSVSRRLVYHIKCIHHEYLKFIIKSHSAPHTLIYLQLFAYRLWSLSLWWLSDHTKHYGH